MYEEISERQQFQILAIISCFFSFLVILTLIMFPIMRRKLFMRIITYISIGDFFGNLPYVSIDRPNGGFWCSLQGFCNLYFYPVSWLWTTILLFFLYSVAVKGTLPLSEPLIHLICWGFPLITTLMILTSNSYARFSNDDDANICSIGGNYTSAFIWHMISYYGLYIVCVLIMIGFYIKVAIIRRRGELSINILNLLDSAIETLRFYPMLMILCWTPECVTFILQYSENKDSSYRLSIALKILNGLFTSIVFFYNSAQSRRLWWIYFFGNANALIERQGSVESSGTFATDDFSIEYEGNNQNINNTKHSIHHSSDVYNPQTLQMTF